MRRHLVRWHEKFARDGLVIVEIDGGRYEDLADVKRRVGEQGVKHRVLWDEECRNHRRYDVAGWPFAVLIGRDGQVRWQGRPSKAFVPGEGRQTVVDKSTRVVLERLISRALDEPSRGEVAWNRKEARP